ncbi:MAG TPA: hypothetical protein VHC92_12200 [Rhodanobacteraceae bacterium]|nr:hypothetical protein [Rhodanobacteraceae bacterium]
MSSGHRFDETEQREWAAQERARERSDGDDPLALRYREVMRALDALPRLVLPPDFAMRVARSVEKNARRDDSFLAPFERFMLFVLIAVFALGTAIAGAMSGALPGIGDFLRDARAFAGVRWLAAVALCVALFVFPFPRLRGRKG